MRGLNITPSTSPYRAEGDKLYCFAQYNDVSGSLTIGQPCYLDVRDSAEFNAAYTTTAVLSGVGLNVQTCGNVVLGTTSAGTGSTLTCMGIFAPDNQSAKPNKGDIIRLLVQGRGIVKVTTAASATATTVGAKLIASSTYATAVAGSAAAGQTIGTVTATGANVPSAAVIQAVPGSGTTTCTVNAFISLC